MAGGTIMFDYALLYGKLKEKKITQKMLADEIPMGVTALNLSLNNRRDFSSEEIVGICKALQIETEDIPKYFFCEIT